MPKLLIESHKGELTIKVEGIAGPACEQWIDNIKEKLRGTIVEEEYTHEYYQQEGTKEPIPE